MEFRNTSQQTARSSMPDGEAFNTMYLIKNVSYLRVTYQIRLLAFRAVTEQKKLVIKVPARCRFSPPLIELIRISGNRVSRESY